MKGKKDEVGMFYGSTNAFILGISGCKGFNIKVFIHNL